MSTSISLSSSSKSISLGTSSESQTPSYYSFSSVDQDFPCSSKKPSKKSPKHTPKKSPNRCDKVRNKINFGPFQSPTGIKIREPSSPPTTAKKAMITPLTNEQLNPKWKGKELVHINSDSESDDSSWIQPPTKKRNLPSPPSSSHSPLKKVKLPTPSDSPSRSQTASNSNNLRTTPSSSTEGGYGLFVSPKINKLHPDWNPINPDLDEQIQAFKMLDSPKKSDSFKRKKKIKVPKNKKGKSRFVKVFMGGPDLSEKGYSLLITSQTRFAKLYEKYGGWQNYSPSDFDFWYKSKKLRPHQCPDDVGLPHQARLVARPKYRWMNMDSRLVVVTLTEIVNAPEGIRLTIHKNEPMTSVYDRVANITGLTLSVLRVGVRGKVVDNQGQVLDTVIRNEDNLWWMEYSSDLKFW